MKMVLCIHHALRDREWRTDDVLEVLASAMQSKFDKYSEGKYNMALVIATILNPTKKMDYLEFFFQKVCDNEDDIDKNVELTKDWIRKYFEKYEQLVRRNGEDPVSHTSEVRSSVGSPVLGKKRVEEEFVQYMSQRRVR